MWKEPFKIGLPNWVVDFAEVAVFAFVGLLMSKFGTSIIASHQAAMNFATVVYAFPISISTALTIIVSYEVGRKDIRSTMQFILYWNCGGCDTCYYDVNIISAQYPIGGHVYGTDPDFIQLTVVFLTYSLLFPTV